MARGEHSALQRRIDAVRERVDIGTVIGAVIKLRGGNNPRGKCPFHGSKSDSFAVYRGTNGTGGRARCWGCGWSGDAIGFVRDHYSLDFGQALARLESDHGLEGLAAAPISRDRKPFERRPSPQGEPVSAAEWAKHIWDAAETGAAGVSRYLIARGVPASAIPDGGFRDLRFAGQVPIFAWYEGRSPDSVPQAPAIVARIRKPPEFKVVAIHVTFLSPDGTGKMQRRDRDGGTMSARKMIGPAGGGVVLLGSLDGDPPIYIGEGIETTLSGMALLAAPAGACGVAALSLGTLQGQWRTWKGGVLPLFDVTPDPERTGVAWAGVAPVTVLIDADMKPLTGRAAPPLVEQRGGPIVRRDLSSVERSQICATLATLSWRAAGRRRVQALRPHMGQDFNDAVRDGLAGVSV